jgi:hypothetical protein
LAQYSGNTPPTAVHLGLIDLQSNVGELPLPVSSAPIRFVRECPSGPQGSPKKQDEIDRFFVFDKQNLDTDENFPALNSMVIREHTAFDLDKVLNRTFPS